jgi:hypothetical protein
MLGVWGFFVSVNSSGDGLDRALAARVIAGEDDTMEQDLARRLAGRLEVTITRSRDGL